MIVVSDTTPLNYLILIGQAEILPLLYGRIVVPQAVLNELQHKRAPAAVKEWATQCPSWLEAQQATALPDAELRRLDEGERAAIILAEQLSADALIMDERDGVRTARRRGLRVIGTLGVLAEAAERGMLDLPETLTWLRQTNFRAAPTLLQALLEREAGREDQPAPTKTPDTEPDTPPDESQ